MRISRRDLGRTFGGSIGLAAASAAAPVIAQAAHPPLTVAFAGSMGVLMNEGFGPEFTKQTGAAFRGIGEGAFALARQIAAGTMLPDAFISITPGPINVVEKAGKITSAVPIASTAMVIAYSPKSRFVKQLEAAATGRMRWWEVLQARNLRFGRTDPRTDPQGRNIVFTFKLAERYYNQPHLLQNVLGPVINPSQIFTEPSLLARLDTGELDATSGYESAVKSLKLPFIKLPDEINLSNPAMVQSWYNTVSLTLEVKGRKTLVRPQPLVFYAAILKEAPNPELAKQFVALLTSTEGAVMLTKYGYNPPLGLPI